MDFKEAFKTFTESMESKFILRDSRYGENSVLRRNVTVFTRTQVHGHLLEELKEYFSAISEEDKAKELLDIANLALLEWWHIQETSKKDFRGSNGNSR